MNIELLLEKLRRHASAINIFELPGTMNRDYVLRDIDTLERAQKILEHYKDKEFSK